MGVNQLIEEIAQEVLKELGQTGTLGGLGGYGGMVQNQAGPTGITSTALAKMIDHTLLKPDATVGEIEKLCAEARENQFCSVCVNPTHVRLAAKLLANSGVKVCTVIGFPLGASTPLVKAIEVRDAIANGATEVDMVINIGALKSGNYDLVARDIAAVVDAAAGAALTKVIIETCLLNETEKIKACLLAKNAGADFVKTSTGFSKGGATAEDIALMRKTVGPEMGVKASGGIRDRQTAERMVKAGANRLGTSSGVSIVQGVNEHQCVQCGKCNMVCPTGNVKVVQSY